MSCSTPGSSIVHIPSFHPSTKSKTDKITHPGNSSVAVNTEKLLPAVALARRVRVVASALDAMVESRGLTLGEAGFVHSGSSGFIG